MVPLKKQDRLVKKDLYRPKSYNFFGIDETGNNRSKGLNHFALLRQPALA